MTHKIALVHGMGEHAEKWSEGVQKQFKKQYTSLKSAFAPKFEDAFEFVEVRYDNVFEAQRERWKTQSDEVLESLKTGGISAGALQELAEATQNLGDYNFFMTHVLDVVLYKWFPLLAEEVRLTVSESFLDIAKSSSQWSIVAHSLGTAVTHDTLQAMFTHRVDGDLLPRVYRPAHLWMVANVSRVVSENDVYRSLVRPRLQIAYGLCEEYFSARHEFDPFPMVRPFQSDNEDAVRWREEAGGLYVHVPLSGENVTHWNVHGFEHYLAIPGCFVPMMRSLAGRASIEPGKLASYVAAYEKTTAEGVAREVKKAFKAIDPANMSSIEGFIKALRLFYTFLKNQRGM